MVKSKLVKGISCVLALCMMLCSSVVTGFALDDANSVSDEVDLGFAITTADYTLIAPKKIGDVSDDGTVNLRDAILIQKAVINNNMVVEWKSKGMFAAADVNGDGMIAMNDAILVMKAVSNEKDLGTYYPSTSDKDWTAYIDDKGFLQILNSCNNSCIVITPDGYYNECPFDNLKTVSPDLYIVKNGKAYITCTNYNRGTYFYVCSRFVIDKDNNLITENSYCYPEDTYILETSKAAYVAKGYEAYKVPPTGIII